MCRDPLGTCREVCSANAITSGVTDASPQHSRATQGKDNKPIIRGWRWLERKEWLPFEDAAAAKYLQMTPEDLNRRLEDVTLDKLKDVGKSLGERLRCPLDY